MRIMNNIAAQGEAFFRRVTEVPTENTKSVAAENNKFIVAHSETGHHHVVDTDGVQLLERTDDVGEGLRVLYMIVENPTTLEHLRPHDTHEPILFNEGIYEVRLQREYTPEGYRAVAD